MRLVRLFPRLLVCAFVLVLAVPVPPSHAQTQRDRELCAGDDAEVAIAACSRLITRAAKASVADRAIFYANRGRALNDLGRIDAAIRDLDESIALNPKDAKAWVNRGFAYRNRGDTQAALRDYAEAIRLDPKLAGAYNNRGFLYRYLGDFDRAVREYDEALRHDPRHTPALNNRGFVRILTGDLDRAMRDFDETLRIDPKNANAHRMRGMVYQRRGDGVAAMREFDEAIRLDPKRAATWRVRGEFLAARGDLDAALADLTEALRLAPSDAVAHTQRGLARERKGDRAGAAADFRLAIALPETFDSRASQATAREHLARLGGSSDTVQAPPPATAPVAALAPSGDTAPLATSPAPPSFNRRVALVVGNSEYRHAPSLLNPRNDAGDVAATLRRIGFDVVEGRDLDRRGMDDAIRAFGRKLDRADLAVFFYAGHGLQVAGRNYLVPVDAALERPGDLALDAIDVGSVLAQMEADKRVNLVFLDACRDNPLARSLARSLGTRSAAVGSGLASIQSALGTMIAYATQPDNVALDGEGRNSPFTTALVKHLATPGLDISTVMRRVRADVVAATREKQVPWDHSSLIGEVVLVK